MSRGTSEILTTAASARLLSLGLSRPTGEGLARLARLAEALGEEELAEAAAAADPEDLAAEYETLFGSDGRCPPYEGEYEPDPFRKTRQLADLAGFYRAFGAQAGGPEAERPDHAGCELEFLAFLALRRAECLERGDAAGADVCREAEDAFLRDHAGRWLPPFFADVEAVAESPVYRALARGGRRILVTELGKRGIEPVPSQEQRREPRSAVEADELTCGEACGTVAELSGHGLPLK